MIEIEVDNRARVRGLSPELAEKIRLAFTHKNPKREAMRAAKVRGWWAEPATIPTWGEDGERLTIPRGGMKRLRAILTEAGERFGIRDLRIAGKSVDMGALSRPLWPHQERIVEACLRRENCLIKSGTASGKTSAALALISRIRVPTLVVVHSTALMEQWLERAVNELGFAERDVGQLGDGKARVGDLTIGTQKTVTKHATSSAFRERWGAVIADEVHLFAARTFFASIDPFPARYRIGVSDDEKRKDRKEFLIYDLFGDVEERVTDQELVAGGHVMEVEVLVVPTEFAAEWYGAGGDGDEKSPEYGRLLEEMSNDPERNEIVRSILETELGEGRQALVMSDRREHCQTLSAMASRVARTGHMIGGPDYKAEFARTKRGMKAGTIRCGVGTFQACGTGIDIPGVEVVVAASPVLANKTRFRQAMGRAKRKPSGKTVARFYVLWDQRVHGLRHVQNAAAWNPTTFVWSGGEWVPARDFLKRARLAGG